MNAAAVGTALRVLGSAADKELLVDRPSCVDIYGRGLEPVEVRWLFLGMTTPDIELLPYTGGDRSVVEDVQISGVILGRMYRVLLRGRDFAGLLGDLAKEQAGHVIAARAVIS